MFSFEGCSLAVLYGGLGIGKLQFLIIKIFNFYFQLLNPTNCYQAVRNTGVGIQDTKKTCLRCGSVSRGKKYRIPEPHPQHCEKQCFSLSYVFITPTFLEVCLNSGSI
jgi:hypothetical protein